MAAYKLLQLAFLLWEITCHIGSQCHLPAYLDIPDFSPAKLVLDLAPMEGCKAEVTCEDIWSQNHSLDVKVYNN